MSKSSLFAKPRITDGVLLHSAHANGFREKNIYTNQTKQNIRKEITENRKHPARSTCAGASASRCNAVIFELKMPWEAWESEIAYATRLCHCGFTCQIHSRRDPGGLCQVVPPPTHCASTTVLVVAPLRRHSLGEWRMGPPRSSIPPSPSIFIANMCRSSSDLLVQTRPTPTSTAFLIGSLTNPYAGFKCLQGSPWVGPCLSVSRLCLTITLSDIQRIMLNTELKYIYIFFFCISGSGGVPVFSGLGGA